MLWDVDLYGLLIIIIQSLASIIALAAVWVTVRRILRKRYYRRLDSAREHYRPLVVVTIDGSFEGDLKLLRRRPKTVEWLAIEDCLFSLIEKASIEKRERAVELFERLGYVGYYLKELRSTKSWRRAKAAHQLGMMRSARAVSQLLKVLEDEIADVRHSALWALGQIRDPRAAECLTRKLKQAIVNKKNLSRRVLIATLVSLGNAAVPHLMGELSHPTDGIRALAVEILGEISDRRALQGLIRTTEDHSPQVRSRAAYALGRIRDPLAVAPLIALLGDPFWYVRFLAAKSLGQLASPRAIFSLSLCLTDTHAQVRRAAADSLGRIGPPALEALAPHLIYTADRYARDQVADVLQRYGLIDRWIEDLDIADEAWHDQIQSLLRAALQGGTLSSMIHALQSHPRRQVRIKLIELLGTAHLPLANQALRRAALYDADPLVREKAWEEVQKVIAKN